MSSLTKNLLWASVGGVVGYWVAQRRLEKHYNERLNEMINTTREHYRLKYEKNTFGQDIPEQATETVEVERVLEEEVTEFPDVEMPPRPEKNPDQVLVGMGLGSVMTDYNGISTKPKVEVPEVKPEDAPKEEVPDVDQPVVISEEQYFENVSGFAQFECVYYVGDDQLAGQSGRIISSFDRAFSLGEGVIEILKTGVGMPDNETIYVSSKRAGDGVGADFQVFRHAGMYTEEVGPIGSVE